MVKIWHFTPIRIANLTLGLSSTWSGVVELFWNVKNGRFDIAEIKLRAERRIGEFSRELPKNYNRSNQSKVAVPRDGGQPDKTSILKEAGITHCERYETVASLPDEVFEKHIQEVKQSLV